MAAAPRDTDLYIDALNIYAQTGNVAMTRRILTERGYVVAEGSVRNWYRHNKEDWEAARKQYVKELAETKMLSSNFLEKEILYIKDTKDLIDKKMQEIMKAGDVKLNDLNMALCMTEKIGSYLLRIFKEKNKDREDTDPYLKALTKILLAHPRIGPIFKEERLAIQADIKRTLRRLKKD